MKRSIAQIREQLRKKPIERSFVIERDAAVDEEARTVNVAFASDQPIGHWFGQLALDVTSKAMRSERLANGAAVLNEHRRDQQVGVVENFSLKGGIARADIRFSTNPLATEIWNDVKDGIKRNVSVGFMLHEMHLVSEGTKDAEPVYGSSDWEPFEISIVSVPADAGVGVGRELDLVREDDADDICPECEEPMADCTCEAETSSSRALNRANSTPRNTQMKTAEQLAAEAAAAANGAGSPAVERSAEVIAAERTAAIMDFASCFGETGTTIARNMLIASDAVTLEDVRTAIRAAQPQTVVVPPMDVATSAIRSGADPQGVQLARTLPRYGTLRNFTGQNGAERAHRFGQWIIGVRGLSSGLASEGAFARAATFCRDNGIVLSRAMGEGVNESGGFLVPEEFGNDLIDLREIYGVFRRNAKMVPMSSDTRSDPRRTGGLTAYFAAEGDAITASDKSWDRIELTAKKLTVLSRYSNELNEDAVINLGDDLAGEIAYAFALKEDQCGFISDGTSTYGGMQGVCTKIKGLSATIANIAGLTVATGTGYATNYASTVLADFEAVVGKLPVYADTPRAKWYCHKAFYWNVMVKLALAAGGATGSETTSGVAKRFLGYDVEFVQVLPSTSAVSQVCALLGDLSLAASFGSRRDTTLAISEHSRFANDQLEIRGTERFDINVHDVGNASATAGSRVAGPIVGLITAAS